MAKSTAVAKRPQGFQVGNAHGRVGTENRLRKKYLTQQLISELDQIDPAKGSGGAIKMHRLVEKLVANGLEGDMQAIAFIFERIEGKVPQPVVGEDGGPIQFEMIRRVVVDGAMTSESRIIDVTPTKKNEPSGS